MEIRRIYIDKLLREIESPFISILIGPRQTGKSFLLKQIERECRGRGLKTAFYNLEFPDDLLKFSMDERSVIHFLEKGPEIVFIDEFHYLKNATKIFKAVYDSGGKIKIFASGSSSIEIHRHLKESLAGRFRVTEIQPLSVSELGQLKKYDAEDYFVTGGMPGIIHEKTFDAKIELLKNIVQTYLIKDIKSLIREENIRAFNHLLHLLAHNQGSISTVAGFAREVRLSEPAVAVHLDILEQTRVCFPLSSYSGNLGNELKKSKKYYLYDIGIRNSLLNDFSGIGGRDDRGAILESSVFLSIKRQLKANMEVRFWRTRQGDEVDFILVKNRAPFPVEVKYSLDSMHIPPGVMKFLSHYKNAPGAYVVSMNLQGVTMYGNRPVRFITWREVEKLEYLVNAD